MATCAADRLVETCPSWSDWTGGTIATDPLTTGTEQTDQAVIDLGTIAVSTNSDTAVAGAMSLEFPAGFDDTINTIGAKIWMANYPRTFTDHAFAAEFAVGAILPAGTTDAVLGGVTAATLAGSPYQVPSVHIKTTTGEYVPADKRIATMILQYQAGALAESWNWSENIYACPQLVLETPRTDYTAQDRIIREELVNTDAETGHLWSYPNTRLYIIENYDTATETWYLLESAREETVEMTWAKDYVMWNKGRPSVEFHRAVSTVESTISFNAADNAPGLIAKSLQTAAARRSGDRVVRTDVSANPCISGVIETAFCVEYQTLGGFICRYIIPRGVLNMTGDGGSDFTEYSYEVTALSSGTGRILAFKDVSDTPKLITFIPVTYDQT